MDTPAEISDVQTSPDSAPAPQPELRPRLSLRPIIITLTLIFSALLGVGGYAAYQEYVRPSFVTSYEECVKANGNQTTTMYPPTCTTKDGKVFTQNTDSSDSASPAPDRKTDWKTYTNTMYHYSIQYPSDWTYREFPGTKSGAGFRPPDGPQDISGEYIVIDFMKRPLLYENTPFFEYVKIAGTQEIQNGNSLASIQPVTTTEGVGGFTAYWNATPLTPDDGRRTATPGTILLGPYTYFDTGRTDGATIQIILSNDKYRQTYDEMITTFTFERPEITPNPYTCPPGEWVDCMPGPDSEGIRWQCTEAYLTWAKANCPGFRGAAL